MTELDTLLSEIETRAEKATPGVWEYGEYVYKSRSRGKLYENRMKFVGIRIPPITKRPNMPAQLADRHMQKICTAPRGEISDAIIPNLEFIAASRTDIPVLLRAIEILRRQRDLLNKAHCDQYGFVLEQATSDDDAEVLEGMKNEKPA